MPDTPSTGQKTQPIRVSIPAGGSQGFGEATISETASMSQQPQPVQVSIPVSGKEGIGGASVVPPTFLEK